MANRRRAPWLWLVVAAVLLGVGAWLMRGAEPPEREPPPQVRLPTRMTRVERERADVRSSWQVPAYDAGPGVAPQAPRDPLLAMMPAEVKYGAVVAEFNAIMNSELGGLMAACFFGDAQAVFADAGFDPSRQIDRVAMIDDVVSVTGSFKGTDWAQLFPNSSVARDYGPRAQLHERPLANGQVQRFATWRGEMLLLADNEAELMRVIDRLEGSTPPVAQPVLNDSMAYGEVYGVLAANALADMLGETDPRLGETIRQTAKNAQLHMDVSRDVGMVADIEANDSKKAEELRRTLGGALSLARMQAQAKGDDGVADLLDLARVRSAEGGQGFRLEAGLPYEFMEDALKGCVERGKRKRALARESEAAQQ